MKRREFIRLIGGAAAAWPLAARGQQGERIRRVGLITPLAADDPGGQQRKATFLQGLQELGWTDGGNIQVIYRWGAADANRIHQSAAELIALAPDVILAQGSSTVGWLQQATHTVPIVFLAVIDPVGAGFVDSYAHAGGNITGFTQFEYSFSGKWLELLKEIAPGIRRVAVLRDATIAAGSGQLGALQGIASSSGVELRPINVRDATEIKNAVTEFARSADGAMIVTGSPLAIVQRKLIVTLAATNKLPAIYWDRAPVNDGGLISYGADLIAQYRHAATYVDRILKGEKPADLPVQTPTKYELVINLKTAKTLGLTVPPSLITRADEVIE
jgi:putative tryptophan/tyrosine transport system substrate-binding protein